MPSTAGIGAATVGQQTDKFVATGVRYPYPGYPGTGNGDGEDVITRRCWTDHAVQLLAAGPRVQHAGQGRRDDGAL